MPFNRWSCAWILLAAVSSCSAEEEGEIFPPEAAQGVAQRFHEALLKGDAQAAARLCRVPFRYKDASRVWPDAAALQTNLAKELPRFRHLLDGLDRIEVFSRADLLAGRWPRGRNVPEERRLEEAQALGLEPYGWIARIHSEGRAGYVIVLNSEGAERLAVQMLDI